MSSVAQAKNQTLSRLSGTSCVCSEGQWQLVEPVCVTAEPVQTNPILFLTRSETIVYPTYKEHLETPLVTLVNTTREGHL